MIEAGITSFKLYMTYPAMMVGDGDIYKIIKKLNKEGCFAGVHCENAEVIDALSREAKAAGRLGPENHPLVRPDTMEADAGRDRGQYYGRDRKGEKPALYSIL